MSEIEAAHWITLGDIARERRRSTPDACAAVCGNTRLTYRELDDRSSRLANGLHGLGVGQGDLVMWLGQNCHRVLEGIVAAAKLGATFCPVNWRWARPELIHALQEAGPKVILWQEFPGCEEAVPLRQRAESHVPWLWCGDEPADDHGGLDDSYEDLIARSGADDAEMLVSPWTPAIMIHTAAWDGRQNGALLSHMGIICQNVVTAWTEDIDADCIYLNAGPLFHMATLWHTLTVFHMGGTNVFIPIADPRLICESITRERCTRSFIVEPTISRIIELNRSGSYDLTSLEVPGNAKPEWLSMTKPERGDWARRGIVYGQTEVSGQLIFSFMQAQGAHGRPLPMSVVRILDEDGTERSAGTIGEIAVRGPSVMMGYRDRDPLNAYRYRGGWYRTGDLGVRESNGSLSFRGPKGRLIKSAAENIYPAEVEAVISAHPAVAEVAIIGVPDPEWRQSVKAIVVLRQGAELSADEIIEHCRRSLSSYKKPKFVEFATSLPRAGIRVDYEALDKQYGGGGYPGRQ
ncbi:MAG: AMP-binding protein [Streptosporangiaceae bacterium]